MTRVVIAGVGMTPFGRYLNKGVRALASEAIDEALRDAGMGPHQVSRIYFANAAAGIITQQEMIRGQVALRKHALAISRRAASRPAGAGTNQYRHFVFPQRKGNDILPVGCQPSIENHDW